MIREGSLPLFLGWYSPYKRIREVLVDLGDADWLKGSLTFVEDFKTSGESLL